MRLVLITNLLVGGIGCGPQSPAPSTGSLAEARRGFQTKLVRREADHMALPQPPPDLFDVVHYDSPAGSLAALVSLDPKDGKKHAAIVWVTSSDFNSIDDGIWKSMPEDFDQTNQAVRAFREAGILMMFPTFRGGNENPGVKEGFFGEISDLLAATDYLAKRSFIDPEHIYLGGLSTGGTVVLLAAEMSDRFRAVFAFGPADEITGYSADLLPFDQSNPKELELRSPGRWLHCIGSSTFVFEGTIRGNLACLRAMERAPKNQKIRFHPVKGATHVTVLGPTARLIAAKIPLDTGPTCNISFSEEELNRPFLK